MAIPKYSAEDTTLVIGNAAGETTLLAIPAGSRVTVNVVGLHYNRKTYLVWRAHPGCLRRVTQRGTGTTRTPSNQKGS